MSILGIRQTRLDDEGNGYALAGHLCGTQGWPDCRLWFLLSGCLVSLFLLLFVCERGEATCGFADLDVLEGLGQLTDMVFDKGRVEGLVLMSFDDEFDDLCRQGLEILLGARIGGNERIKLFRGRS